MSDPPAADPADVVRRYRAEGLTVATGESLTGGLLAARLADVPGASAVLRGGVVAYATDLKASLLGVDPALLARVGPVDAEVARQMAVGARERLGADVGVATTGVAGPDAQGGHRPGTVLVAVSGVPGSRVQALRLPGDRAMIREATVRAALALLLDVAEHPAERRR